MQFTVKGQTFESPYTGSEAIEIVAKLGNSFGNSLVNQYNRRGKLSEKQWPWVHKLAVDANTEKPAAREGIAGFSNIIAFFAVACENGMKRPKIEFPRAKLSLAGPRSRVAGSIHVAQGAYPGTYFGYIDATGTFFPGRGYDEDILNFLRTLEKDPVGIAIEHGKESGSCVFCSKELTTTESVSAGYGPVCAKKWSLPWGKKGGLRTVADIFRKAS
jgi:hypothetical protein